MKCPKCGKQHYKVTFRAYVTEESKNGDRYFHLGDLRVEDVFKIECQECFYSDDSWAREWFELRRENYSPPQCIVKEPISSPKYVVHWRDDKKSEMKFNVYKNGKWGN